MMGNNILMFATSLNNKTIHLTPACRVGSPSIHRKIKNIHTPITKASVSNPLY